MSSSLPHPQTLMSPAFIACRMTPEISFVSRPSPPQKNRELGNEPTWAWASVNEFTAYGPVFSSIVICFKCAAEILRVCSGLTSTLTTWRWKKINLYYSLYCRVSLGGQCNCRATIQRIGYCEGAVAAIAHVWNCLQNGLFSSFLFPSFTFPPTPPLSLLPLFLPYIPFTSLLTSVLLSSLISTIFLSLPSLQPTQSERDSLSDKTCSLQSNLDNMYKWVHTWTS